MISLRKSLLMAIVYGAMAIASPAVAEEVTFASPTVGSQPLDLCLNWGEGCGKPAADAWCVNAGFAESTTHLVADDVGASTPTRLISTGAVCDQAFCDAISKVTCFRPDPVEQVYAEPMFNGYRLDYCAVWGTQCGEPAATAFCQLNGWAYASDFVIANDIGGSQWTRVITTGAICDQGYCDGFQTVTCRN